MFFRNQVTQSGTDSTGMDYRYYSMQGVPFRGNPPLMNSNEYQQHTRRMADAKSAMFDARNPDDEHHGRTLADVLEGARREEYEIFRYEEYNNGVAGDDPNSPPALFIWLVWFEKYDILSKNVTDAVRRK